MVKKNQKPEEKLAEGKKASKAANKKKMKNKVNTEAKKLSDKMLTEIASELPAGQGNAFLQLNIKHDKADEMVAAALAFRRQVRAELKGIKVDMDCLNRVRKLRKMDIEDVRAKKATEALYENQLSMELSPEQKKIIDDITVKRENVRASMSTLTGNETGKEVGSGTDEQDEVQADNKITALPTLPERNDTIGESFRAPEKLAAAPSVH